MKLKRIVTAALVAASLGISAPSAQAKHRRVVRRVVVVEPQRVVRRAHRHVRRHVNRAPRFLPLPAPSFLPVPPPFYRR